MTGESEAAAELVRDLQKENEELCDKERRRVQDDREREGDLEEELAIKHKKEQVEVIIILEHQLL